MCSIRFFAIWRFSIASYLKTEHSSTLQTFPDFLPKHGVTKTQFSQNFSTVFPEILVADVILMLGRVLNVSRRYQRRFRAVEKIRQGAESPPPPSGAHVKALSYTPGYYSIYFWSAMCFMHKLCRLRCYLMCCLFVYWLSKTRRHLRSFCALFDVLVLNITLIAGANNSHKCWVGVAWLGWVRSRYSYARQKWIGERRENWDARE